MKPKYLLLAFFIAIQFTACSSLMMTTHDVVNQKVSLGMTKNELGKALKDYTTASAIKDEQGNYIETLGYGRYRFVLTNGILTEWYTEPEYKYVTSEPSQN